VPEAVKMSKKPKKSVPEVSPLAFLNLARQYHEAAEILFAECDRRVSSGGQREITDPTYFLYYHAIELAFKAYRRAHGLTNKEHHKLTTLYEECQKLGLVIWPEFEIKNLVNLLESGEDYIRFRYFILKSSSQPDLSWTREVVGSVMQTISDKLDVLFPPDSRPTRAVKMILSIGKPVPK
jgi:HEPN domain-containing protein